MKRRLLSLCIIFIVITATCPVFLNEAKAEDKVLEFLINSFDKIQAIIDPVKGVYSTASEVAKMFSSDPDFEELLDQATIKIVNEIQDLRDNKLKYRVEGMLQRYRFNVLVDPEYHMKSWLDESIDIQSQLEGIIDDEKYNTANLIIIAQAYNTIATLHTTVMQMRKDDKNIISNFLRKIMRYNIILAGPLTFENSPGIPSYQRKKGKLEGEKLEEGRRLTVAYRKGKGIYGVNDREYAVYDKTMQIVWKMNESIRTIILENYDFQTKWYKIVSLRNDLPAGISSYPMKCLYSNPGKGVFKSVDLRACGSSNNYLWRLEFNRYDEAKIIHFSGLCLINEHRQDHDVIDRSRLINCDNQYHSLDVLWDIRGVEDGALIRSLWLGAKGNPKELETYPIRGGYLTPEGTPDTIQFLHGTSTFNLTDLCYEQDALCPVFKLNESFPNDKKQAVNPIPAPKNLRVIQ